MGDKGRVAVFIDGSNLYFKLKSFGILNLLRFNYRGLIDWLVRDRQLVHLNYYVGVVRAKRDKLREQQLRQNQVRLFNHLQSSSQGFTIRKGYLMRNDGVYHEKGVDVQLAVDLVVGAFENAYDMAIVISSDTDLIPAIHKAKELGKQIEYIGFAHESSFGMQSNSTLSRLLIKEEIDQFVPKTLI